MPTFPKDIHSYYRSLSGQLGQFYTHVYTLECEFICGGFNMALLHMNYNPVVVYNEVTNEESILYACAYMCIACIMLP